MKTNVVEAQGVGRNGRQTKIDEHKVVDSIFGGIDKESLPLLTALLLIQSCTDSSWSN